MLRSMILLGASFFVFSQNDAFAAKVTSNSKYPVIVEVFEGDCKPDKGVFDKMGEEYEKASESKKGKLETGLSFIKGVANVLTEQDGCKNVGSHELAKGKSIPVNKGQLIVAYKDPVAAWKNHEKVVNPTPGFCKVEQGVDMTLDTRKSETLGSWIGIKGDAGLACNKVR